MILMSIRLAKYALCLNGIYDIATTKITAFSKLLQYFKHPDKLIFFVLVNKLNKIIKAL